TASGQPPCPPHVLAWSPGLPSSVLLLGNTLCEASASSPVTFLMRHIAALRRAVRAEYPGGARGAGAPRPAGPQPRDSAARTTHAQPAPAGGAARGGHDESRHPSPA